MNATETKMMVELSPGYGDGYGVVLIDETDRPIVNPGIKNPRYANDWPMEEWRKNILKQSTISLVDAGVSVPVGAVRRIIGPLDCPEAMRVRLRRYTKNWGDNAFAEMCTDEELRAMFAADDERGLHTACVSLRAQYQKSY